MTFRLSPSYGLTTGHEANEWFIDMLRDHEEFEVDRRAVSSVGSERLVYTQEVTGSNPVPPTSIYKGLWLICVSWYWS